MRKTDLPGVVEPERSGLRNCGIKGTTDAPGELSEGRDEEGEAALDRVMRMALLVDVADYQYSEHDESDADETLRPCIKSCGQRQVEHDDSSAKGDHSERVAQGVGEAKAHAFAPGALDGGDIRDGGKVIVVKAVPQPEQGAGGERESDLPVHGCLRIDAA